MAVLLVDPPEVLEVDVDDAHHVPLRIALEQRALDPVDEEHAVGELGQRVVEGTIRQLVLERGQSQQPVVEAAALDGEGDDVGERLEGLVVDAVLADLGPAHAQGQVADRARVEPERHRQAARDAEAAREPRHPGIGAGGGDVHHAVDRRCQGPILLVVEIDGAHHVQRLAVADRGPERGRGARVGHERQLAAVGPEAMARAPEEVHRGGLEVAGLEQRS